MVRSWLDRPILTCSTRPRPHSGVETRRRRRRLGQTQSSEGLQCLVQIVGPGCQGSCLFVDWLCRDVFLHWTLLLQWLCCLHHYFQYPFPFSSRVEEEDYWWAWDSVDSEWNSSCGKGLIQDAWVCIVSLGPCFLIFPFYQFAASSRERPSRQRL